MHLVHLGCPARLQESGRSRQAIDISTLTSDSYQRTSAVSPSPAAWKPILRLPRQYIEPSTTCGRIHLRAALTLMAGQNALLRPQHGPYQAERTADLLEVLGHREQLLSASSGSTTWLREPGAGFLLVTQPRSSRVARCLLLVRRLELCCTVPGPRAECLERDSEYCVLVCCSGAGHRDFVLSPPCAVCQYILTLHIFLESLCSDVLPPLLLFATAIVFPAPCKSQIKHRRRVKEAEAL